MAERRRHCLFFGRSFPYLFLRVDSDASTTSWSVTGRLIPVGEQPPRIGERAAFPPWHSPILSVATHVPDRQDESSPSRQWRPLMEISPLGPKRWFWKYNFDRKEKRLALGTYSEAGSSTLAR